MLKLSIVHNIFLKQEEVNILNSNDEISTIGVCLPVWSFNKNTSEPAEEVFCIYEIYNNKSNQLNQVEMLKDRYKIYLPDYCCKICSELTKKQFRQLSDEDKKCCTKSDNKIIFEKQTKLLEKYDDVIAFKQYEKIKIGDKVKLIENFVQIRTMKSLLETFN